MSSKSRWTVRWTLSAALAAFSSFGLGAAPAESQAARAETAGGQAAAAVAAPITVPAGTRLSVSLASDVSTKTAKIGDPVHARLASDVIVDGRTAVAAGTAVHGTVTQVVSGSHKIGGVPTLGLAFDSVDVGNGKTVPIAGQSCSRARTRPPRTPGRSSAAPRWEPSSVTRWTTRRQGQGHRRLLGGAAGAAAAHKTGGEVTLTAGSVLVFATAAPFEVSGG